LFRNKWRLIVPVIIITGLLLFYFRFLILQYFFQNIERVHIQWIGITRQKIVALTFDDGPDPRYTPRILAILNRYKIPAAFFVKGENAQKYPELLMREYRSGYEIGNHSFSHPHLAGLNALKIQAELQKTDKAIQAITGMIPRFFRPPYQELSGGIISVSRRSKKIIVLSTITLEHGSLKTPQALATRVANQAFPGAIILMHDGRLNRSRTVKALPYLINDLKKKGFRFVPVRQLLSANNL
jgi:peptidoglycan/xylan/chitin deacetylase (PgdA/CDA1 family)